MTASSRRGDALEQRLEALERHGAHGVGQVEAIAKKVVGGLAGVKVLVALQGSKALDDAGARRQIAPGNRGVEGGVVENEVVLDREHVFHVGLPRLRELAHGD